ncbi:MAG: hypothetical protein AAB575_05320 [Patescibacteria group bacterium]
MKVEIKFIHADPECETVIAIKHLNLSQFIELLRSEVFGKLGTVKFVLGEIFGLDGTKSKVITYTVTADCADEEKFLSFLNETKE